MAAYNNLVSLKQELELVLPFYQSSPITTFTKAEDDALKKDLEKLRSRFQKYYCKIILLESEFEDSMEESYSSSPIGFVVDYVKMKIGKYILGLDRFKKPYNDVRSSGILRRDFQSWIEEVVNYPDKDLGSLISRRVEYLKLSPDEVKKVRAVIYVYKQITWLVSSMKHKRMARNLPRPLLSRNSQMFYDDVCVMVSLLINSTGESFCREVMINFQNRIRDVVHLAAYRMCSYQPDVIVRFGESDLIPSPKRAKLNPALDMLDLPNLTVEIACFNEELKKIFKDRDVIGKTAPQNSEDTASTSDCLNPPRRSQNKDDKLVGFDKDLEKLLDCLTGQSSSFKVFPIIGMAGIGKTTFARELYHHPLVVHHFCTRAWVTVSQKYQLRGLLLSLLNCLTILSDEIYERNNEQLREQLFRSIKGKRYLIVLDDVWDKQVWDDLKRAFPSDMNGSRVLLTSRLQGLALHASPNVPPHFLQRLSQEESWELLCSKSCVNESCPQELLPIGNQIARKCHGLPLAIVVVGGLLSKMSKTRKVWEEVSQNVGSLIMDGPQNCQEILALSYNNLPDPLKVCFLYMGVFPEDYEVSSKKLVSLWIAEGFVQPEKQKSLEETAEDYLEDLIARCIILVERKRSNGRIKTCYIHDLMRDFCLRESQKENFLHVLPNFGEMPLSNAHEIQKYCKEFEEKGSHYVPRLAIYSNLYMFMKAKPSLNFTRSFFCFETLRPTDFKGFPDISFHKLLKVLDLMHVHLLSPPLGILFLINLKYMALNIRNSFDLSELSVLGSLQTCIIDGEFDGHLPMEFWYLTELRCFSLRRRIPLSHHTYASSAFIFPGSTVMQNLHTLSTIGPSSCTEDKFLHMPNLKKLGVYETEEDDKFVDWYKNLACLTQLETLKYAFSNPFGSSKVRPGHCPSWVVFAPSLMKLTLSGTSFPWEDMHQLSLLPKLEVLKLKNYAFLGATWNLGESCFNCLKFLMIGSTNLELWEADGSHFPSLEHLVLRHCRSLKEIPYGIGEAPMLERIELHRCAGSAATSARQLEEEQKDLGNDWLKVYITER